ncbi:MAG: D-2-hydroxyacid dehydrogenase [Rhodospirillales bacterium]|nr:D-2-hydroxyacid dehydrogenase [Rhodospirillales bacterium]MBT4626623.1 D-2-hydroxyacid dehydrogenase [Rhodospirillales bacterium]MBT6109465.1 D-2-hydroxyacid dehydrogenase [Rhodospirillales bacterium]MBT6825133.1 D-2-hydroxyacid dehydrogenase [Rhodospirillales bacterium]
MMNNPIIILHTDNPGASLDVLNERHSDLEIHTCGSYQALPEMIESVQAEVVYSVRFDGTPKFPRQPLLGAPSVKWVSVGGSGTDHLNPWNADTMIVTNSAGVAADMMAQYAIGAMFHFSLELPTFRAAQQRREWIAGQVQPITGKTVLILGLGQTGMAVARWAKMFNMYTLGVRAHPRPTENVDNVYTTADLPSLWGMADYIVVCTPLLDSTRGIVDADAFASMKESAVLVDVSRGGVTDEVALTNALEGRAIRGAAFDVFATEPLPADNPLWGYDNLIITPHCSSVYEGWDLKSVEMFSENLTRYREGQDLVNIVDPLKGY